MRTVVRILSGRHLQASLQNILSIADVLGMSLSCEECEPINVILMRQALEKSENIIKLVQGTLGLEGQALRKPEREQMKRRTVHELLAGSRRTLWSD